MVEYSGDHVRLLDDLPNDAILGQEIVSPCRLQVAKPVKANW
jgi:hypothetical protein